MSDERIERLLSELASTQGESAAFPVEAGHVAVQRSRVESAAYSQGVEMAAIDEWVKKARGHEKQSRTLGREGLRPRARYVARDRSEPYYSIPSSALKTYGG